MSEYSSYDNFNSEVSDKIKNLAKMAESSTIIAPEYYKQFDVKRGLRDEKGVGVCAGLTEISEIHGYTTDYDGNKIPCKANCITGVSKSRILSAALQAKGVSALKKSRTFCCSANFPTRMNSNRSSAF